MQGRLGWLLLAPISTPDLPLEGEEGEFGTAPRSADGPQPLTRPAATLFPRA